MEIDKRLMEEIEEVMVWTRQKNGLKSITQENKVYYPEPKLFSLLSLEEKLNEKNSNK